MAQQTVALYTVTSGKRLERARRSLSEALDGAELGDVDDAGVFELALDAESPDRARELVQEALARAGTGDDFVLRETTEGREIPADDPRQAQAARRSAAERAGSVADAAASVAAAAAGAAREAAAEGNGAADTVRQFAEQARQAAQDAGGADAARQAADQARQAASAATEERPWLRYAVPMGGLLLLLALLRRRR